MKMLCAVAATAICLCEAGCAPLLQGGDDASRKVDYLRGDIEKLAVQQAQLQEEVRKLREAMGGQPSAASPAPAAASSRAPEVEALEVGQLSGDPAAVYRNAYDLLASGKVRESQTAFAEFIRRFPQSELADNAQYWIGEGFYSQKAWADAKQSFQGVVDHFPFGNKVPDALFKRALCEGELGDKSSEKATLRGLVEQYPFSDAATKANDLLKRLA